MDKVFCADVWFSTAQEQKAHAMAKNFPKDDIHTQGEGAEGWQSLLMSYRNKPGKLGLVGGLYILGQTSDALKKRLADLRAKKIKPYDFDHPEQTGEELYAAAMASILGSRKFRNKKHHRSVSAKGGEGKAISAAKKRGEIAAKWLLQNIARSPHLTWDQKVELVNGKISEASFRRHYL